MIYRKHSEELWEFVNGIAPYMHQDNLKDWDIVLLAVVEWLPLATLDELEVYWHRVLTHCKMNIINGINRHVIVQLWVEMMLDIKRT